MNDPSIGSCTSTAPSTSKGAGAGILFVSPRGEQLKYVLQLLFKATNNEAEYEALIHGLRIAASLGIKRLLAYGDSKVVIQQVNKDWDCTQEKMDAYCKEIRRLEAHFYSLEFHHVLQDYNVAANVLSKLGSKQALIPARVFMQALNSPTVKNEEEPPTKPDLAPALGRVPPSRVVISWLGTYSARTTLHDYPADRHSAGHRKVPPRIRIKARICIPDI